MPNRQTYREDTMALRVPKAELPTELRESMIKQFGAVPEPVEVTWHNPERRPGRLEFGGQGGRVGRGRREPQDVRAHGRRGAGWLQLVPRHQLLPGAEPEPGPGQGEPGAALAGVGGVHAAGAGRAGVRRGHDEHAADRHRRAVGASAGAARPGGDGRAHRVHRLCQPGDQEQHGARDHVAGLLRCVRDSAGRAS